MIEAGYRCAIPTCRAAAPLTIDHIEDWARVQEHKFENMIVLCANCHGRKGNARGQLDRTALRQYKANLALLNYRYGEFERRVLDHFARNPKPNIISVPGGMELLVHYLVTDGYLAEVSGTGAFEVGFQYRDSDGKTYQVSIPDHTTYCLTIPGAEFVQKWKDAQPLNNESDEVVTDS